MTAKNAEFTTFSDLGVLVVGHGTRDLVGQAQMRSLACQAAGQLSPLTTQLGFLELASPTIAEGVARLAADGVRRMLTVPVLLFRAGHADRDIPDAVAAAAQQHNIEVLHQTAPIEHQSTLLTLSAQRFSDALRAADCASVPSDRIALALIARGSSSHTAADAMQQFAQLRVQLTPVGQHAVGYVAVRSPNVAQTLDWLASTEAEVLVVQPHLLFEGEVYHSLCEAIEERRARDRRRWVVTTPLASPADNFEDTRLAEVLAHLVQKELALKQKT